MTSVPRLRRWSIAHWLVLVAVLGIGARHGPTLLQRVLRFGVIICDAPSSTARTRQLLSDLMHACTQYLLDTGDYPTLSRGTLMTEAEGQACLFHALGQGKHLYFDFQDDLVFGGLDQVDGEGADPVEQGLPLGAVVDSWGSAVRYREFRSLESPPPTAHNPRKFDLWSVGPDGVDGTADDITNFVDGKLTPPPPAPYRVPWWSGPAGALLIFAVIVWSMRRRIARAYVIPGTSAPADPPPSVAGLHPE